MATITQLILENTVYTRKREDILRVAAEHGAVSVRLFGSLVRGEAHSNSDLDVLVEFEADRTLLDQVGLRLALQKLLGRNVDVATPNTLHPHIRQKVLDEAIPL